MREKFKFLGPLDEQQMCEEYLTSNVFISPSSIENSSNSIGEAMILGVPVISSDVGGVKSLMEADKEGIIYQGDAPYMLAMNIKKIFEDIDYSKEIGMNARKRATKTHNPEINCNNLIDIYKNIIKTGLNKE